METLKLVINVECHEHNILKNLSATHLNLDEVLELVLYVNYKGKHGWLGFDAPLYKGKVYLDEDNIISSNFSQQEYNEIVQVLRDEPIEITLS